MIEKMSSENKHVVKSPVAVDFVDLEKYEELKSVNEKLQKKLTKVSKNVKKFQESNKSYIDNLEA